MFTVCKGTYFFCQFYYSYYFCTQMELVKGDRKSPIFLLLGANPQTPVKFHQAIEN